MRTSYTMPGTVGHAVERAIVWTTIVATIAWSIGLSFLIKVPSASAAVTATAPATNAISGYKTSLRAAGDTPIAALTLTGSASETLTSIAVTVNSVSGLVVGELDALRLYSNASACTSGTTLAGNSTFKQCGFAMPAVGSSATIPADTDGNSGNGNTAAAIEAAGSTWIIVVATGAGIDNDDQFTVTIAANAIATSASPPTITAFTSDTFTFTTAAADSTAPTCAGAGGPPDGQIGAPADALVDRTCNETLISSRVNTTNVTLKACTGADQSATTSAGAASTACATKGNSVCATVTLNGGTRIECTPAAPLATNTWHEFSIGTGVLDTSGNALATAAIYRFKTGAFGGTGGGGNLTGPNLISQSPAPNATGVGTNANLTATFCLGPECNMKNSTDNAGAMNRIDDVANVSVKKIVNGVPSTEVCTSGTACVLTWASGPRILTVNPAANLEASTSYDFCVRSTAKNQQDIGIPGDKCIRFTTGAGADVSLPALRTTAPTIPANGASAPSPFDDIRVFFSKDMDPATLSLTTVHLCQDSTAGTAGCEVGDTRLTTASDFATRYDAADRAFRISPVANASIAASTRYCIEVVGGGSGVKDTVGNALASTSSSASCFTTGAAIDLVAGGPKVLFVDSDNNKCIVHFNEPMRQAGLVSGGNVVTANVAMATVVDGNTTRVNLTGKPATYRADVRELEIQNLGLTTGQQIKVTITNAADLAGNAMDTTSNNNVGSVLAQSSADTGGTLGASGGGNFFSGTTFGTFALHPSRCLPRSTGTSKATSFECEFDVPSALATSSTFVLSFPSGFTYSTTDGNTRSVPASASFINTDINGPAPNTVTIAASADSGAGTVTVTTTGALAANDHVHFELDRLTTPPTPSTNAQVSIIIKNADGIKVGQTINAAPFSIQTGGALEIKGKVCKGSSSGGTCGGSDTGIANARVFCDQTGSFGTGTAFTGHNETKTDGSGIFDLTGLTSGQYNCVLPPDPTTFADLGGAPTGQMIGLTVTKACAAGDRSDCVDFKFKDMATATDVKTLTVTITGPASKTVDVFCNAGASSFEFSAPVMKSVTLTGGMGTAALKLQQGKTYQCGVGPHMAFEQFGTGAPPPPPTFDFMPPKPQQVVMSADTTATFALITAGNSITGTVKDGSGTGIPNVFVHAAPVGCFDASTGAAKDCFGSFAQTLSDGTFTIKVSPGTFDVGADAPGLPAASPIEVTVTSAGVMSSKGTTITSADLKMLKSSTTISGQVLDESGNAIKYAHVSGQKIATGATCSTGTPNGGFADSPTDSSGNYTLYTAAGTWCVRAFAPAYGEVANTTVVVASSSQSGQNLQATASAYGTISGSVTKGGTAAGGAFVNCFGSSGGNGTQTGADGTYTMKLKAGSYSCDGFLPGVGPLPRKTSVTITASTTLSSQNFTVGNPATITVTIANITDAFCDARDASGFGNGTNQPSSTGVYTINVPAGTYTIRCGGPKYGPITVTPSTATVTAGGTAAATGTAPTTRTVSGRVTDGTSNVAGVTLTFSDTSSGRSFSKSSDATSGSSSNLSVTGVPEGTYNVTATKQGYAPTSTTATVSGGNLTLSSPIALTQVVGNSSGASVTATVQSSGANYSGEATIIATSGTKTVVGEMDASTSTAALALTNGTWTEKAICDNGKESATTTVTVTSGVLSGSAPTLSCATSITGFTPATDSQMLSLSAGGLTKFNNLAVSGKAPEVNFSASALSNSDSSTGTVSMTADPTVKGIISSSDQAFVGSSGYDITVRDGSGNKITTSFNSTVTVTIPYTDADVSAAGVSESDLKACSYNTSSQAWECFPTTVDTTNNLLTATVTHFSSFGILGSSGTGGSSIAGDATPPAAPTNIVASGTASAVTLTWTDPSDADLDSVEVLRSNPPTTAVSGTALSRVAKGTARFVDSTVSAGKSYTYILRSKDRSNNTRNSGEITVTTPASTAAAPSAGTVTAPPAATTTAPPAVTTPAAPAATAPGLATIGLSAGDLVRSSSSSAMYLVGADGKRYVFPNEVTYRSWYKDFSSAKSIAGTQMSQLPLGGVVTVRPGTWLVKIESDPKVYAVEPGGSLRWVETEERAQTLYGMDWNKQIIDVPVSYWPTYTAGTALGTNRHPTGTVVRSGSQTYYIDAGRKRLVSSDVFSGLGFQDRFVKQLSSTVVYEDGPALPSTANLRFASSR